MVMQNRNILDSANNAIEGFIYVVRTQRNMRIHFLSAVLVLILGIYLNFSKAEMMLLGISITFVLVAEMINTAIEQVVDMVTEEAHPIARIIKDISAGAVLVTAINVTIVGYLLFIAHFRRYLANGAILIKQSNWHISFISLIAVLSIVVFGKAFFHKGRPLRGGMPSGHAAVAFSIWTATIFLTDNYLLVTLVFAMAYLVAQSRIRKTIHNIWEVLAGSLLGIFSTALLFKILK